MILIIQSPLEDFVNRLISNHYRKQISKGDCNIDSFVNTQKVPKGTYPRIYSAIN